MLKNCTISYNTDPAEYHYAEKPPGDPKFEMTRSALVKFMRNPARWVEDAGAEQTSPSMLWGSMVDAALLTPDRFQPVVIPTHYTHMVPTCPGCGSTGTGKVCRPCKLEREERAVPTEWSPHSKTCQEWMKENPGAISQPQLDRVQKAVAAIRADARVAELIADSDTQVMVGGEWHDPATGLIIPVKCLLDLVPRIGTRFENSLADLKTTKSAHPSTWPREVYNRGYHVQAAMYRDLYESASLESRPNWRFVLQENYAPYAVGRSLMATDFYECGRDVYTSGLAAYCQCIANGHWPTADDMNPHAVDGWSAAWMEPWMRASFVQSNLEAMAQSEPAPW